MTKPFYQDITITSINTLKRNGAGFSYDTKGNKKTVLLNGLWKFKYYDSVLDVDKSYVDKGYNYSDFDEIYVPSNWQIKGYGIPQYTNYKYPLAIENNKKKLPKINDKINAAGCYMTTFNINMPLEDNVVLNFGGINSAAEIYVNGRFVGYTTDSFDYAEFNINKFIVEGKNTLCVTVYQFSMGSYLEDQDMWRLSGIFRDVNLCFYPKVSISDIFHRSKIEKSNYFLSDITVSANGKDLTNGILRVSILDKNGNKVKEIERQAGSIKNGSEKVINIAEDMGEVELWSIENPYLYKTVYSLYDNNELIDTRNLTIGIRSIKIVPKTQLSEPHIELNGKMIKIFGVNRHDFHPEYGHAVPVKVIEEDIKLCLRNNITSIRTCHYPPNREFYRLCDEYGILVMSENNLETHGLGKYVPSNDEEWTKHCVYRMNNMVNSYKNHASIIFWSLGNEAGNGSAFSAMRTAALNIDNTRPIHYECDDKLKVSDVFSEMYTRQQKLKKIAANKTVVHSRALWNNMMGSVVTPKMYKHKPFLLCEYAHCMGNSLGNFSDYWNDFRKYDRLAGGYIWDFADQAIKRVRENGDVEWCYGGDFGDKPNDGNFAFNGIVRGDRSPNPALYEVKFQYANIRFSKDEDKIIIKNEYLYTNLNQLTLKCTYFKNGEKLYNKECVLDIPPQSTGELIYDSIDETDAEITLNIEVINQKKTMYADAGHIIVGAQFVLTDYPFSKASESLSGAPSVKVYTDRYELYGESYKITVDKKKGLINSYMLKGKEMLKSPIRPNFSRATIDNDAVYNVPAIFRPIFAVNRWYKANSRLKAIRTKLVEKDDCVEVFVWWRMPYMVYVYTLYTFYNSGEIKVNLKCKSISYMERYGITLALRDNIDNVEFYGKGPHENYIDRATSARLGIYKGKAEDFIHDYLYPQENGNHTRVRWLSVGENMGVKVSALERGFNATVHPYTEDMLREAKHSVDLKRLKYLTLNIDGMQRGVGGDVPAIASLKPQYKIAPYIEHQLMCILKFYNVSEDSKKDIKKEKTNTKKSSKKK